MNTILAIIAGLGGILALFFFKRGQGLEALLSLIKTKEKDLELRQELLKNQAAAQQEEKLRKDINSKTEDAKNETLTANELNNMFSKK